MQSGLQQVDRRDQITAFALADLTTYLPCDLMTKVDIASMANSLECRQPFLDVRFVELAASLPIAWKFRRGRGKLLLRRAFGHMLPEAIWNRRKMGFGVPLDHWFRNELKPMTHDVLLSDVAKGRGLFRESYVARLVQDHEQAVFDHSRRLWALLFLECWMRQWCDA